MHLFNLFFNTGYHPIFGYRNIFNIYFLKLIFFPNLLFNFQGFWYLFTAYDGCSTNEVDEKIYECEVVE
jgi:hypothetical protein